jgi:hypothetical protein
MEELYAQYITMKKLIILILLTNQEIYAVVKNSL